MDDVRGDFLRPPHDTIPAAVIANQRTNGPVNAHLRPEIYTKLEW